MSRQSDLDNHANQLNSNNDAYWHSRGWEERPDDWEAPVPQDEYLSQRVDTAKEQGRKQGQR